MSLGSLRVPIHRLACVSCDRELDFFVSFRRHRDLYNQPCPFCPGRTFRVIPKEAA